MQTTGSGTDERLHVSAVEQGTRTRVAAYVHAAILLALVALFVWLFARFFLHPLYLAESDLYENGLPIFLSPIRRWSSFEFSGLPVLADPANFDYYLPNIVFGELLRSWTAVVMSGPLLAACFAYAYVFSTTRSLTAGVYSGLAYGLSEEMLERLRHINHVHAIAWLPLIVLSLDRLRGDRPRRWIGIGAFAVGSCILAGHPQPAMYVLYCAGVYAVAGLVLDRDSGLATPNVGVGTRVSRFDGRNDRWGAGVLRIASMFALGILLSSVKSFPLIEARTLVVRSEGLTFQRFVGPSLSGPQMFTFVFPTILHQPITELPTYVGLATLLLAVVGLTRFRANWRVIFWLVACVIGVGMALGTATPLTTVAYYVPLYSWFRNLSRHLFLFAFGASVLAGFGMAALQDGLVSARTVWRAAAALAVVMIVGALLIHSFPDAFPLEGPHGEPGPGSLSIFSVGVWIQFAILAAIVVPAWWLTLRSGRRSFLQDSRRFAPLALILILIVDLLSALPYDIKRDGIEFYALNDKQIQPSVHAIAIGRALEPTHARALALGGTQVDEVVPATFARAWRIPIAGGYGAMLMDRLSRLANMGTNGEVRAGVLADTDATLDVLAVKYAIVNDDQLQDPERQRWLRGSSRWREAMHFKTSRETDRGVDEDVDGEIGVTVFENQRALPRAWVVGTVLPMLDETVIPIIQSSRLPDGTAFDPRSTVLVDPSTPLPISHFAPGRSDVRVDRIGDGDIGLRVSTEGGGFLVLSENAYPGWRARIDGADANVYRADVTLQGVIVPPGAHRVEFTLESWSLRAGLIVSSVAAIVCVGLLFL